MNGANTANFDYRLEPTKEAFPTLIVSANGREQALHSKMFPSKETTAMEAELSPDGADIFVILGVGLGYHLKPIEACLTAYKQIVLLDVFADASKLIAKAKFAEFVLAADNISLIAGLSPAQTAEKLAALINIDASARIKVICHPASMRVFNDYYTALLASVESIINQKAGSIATAKAFGRRYIKNSIENIARLSQQKPVKALFGKAAGAPAAVLASGPTLENSMPCLAANADKLFIVAADSALPVCLAYGILPDITVSVDPQPYVWEHLAASIYKHPLRIATSFCGYAWKFADICETFLSLNTHPFAQLAEERFPDTFGSINSGAGSVAGDALALALACGCAPIACCGYDFAFERGLTYCRGTAYQNRNSTLFANRLNSAETANLRYIMNSSGAVKANGIFTRKNFLQYKAAAEHTFAGKPLVQISPVVPMEGVSHLHSLQTFVDEYCSADINKAEFTTAASAARPISEIINAGELARLTLDKAIFAELLRRSLSDGESKESADLYAFARQRLA